jgi:hypothetical protein
MDKFRLNSKRVLLIAAALSAVSMVALLVPVAIQAYKEHRERISQEKYEQLSLNQIGLTPCEGNLFMRSYYDRVEQAMSHANPAEPDAKVMILESFGPESELRIYPSSISYAQLKKSIWWNPPVTEVDRNAVSSFVSDINPEVAAQLVELFRGEIQSARETSNEAGADGTSYFFTTKSNCARMWSPSPETRAGRLRELLNLLVQHSMSNDEKSRKDLEEVIKSQTKDLQKSETWLDKFLENF